MKLKLKNAVVTMIIMVCVVVGMSFGMTLSLYGDEPTPLDSRTVGHALNHFGATDKIVGQAWGYYYKEGLYVHDSHQFEMGVNGKFISYYINGVSVPVENLFGIPIKSGGFGQLFLHMESLDVNGQLKSSGYTNIIGVYQGDPVDIVLVPNRIIRTVSPTDLNLPSDISLTDVRIVTSEGEHGYYDQRTKLFIVSVDWRKETSFEVVDFRTGRKLGAGILSPFEPILPSKDSVLNVKNEGGVVEVVFDKTYGNYFGGTFPIDSTVILKDDSVASAKVFTADLENEEVILWGFSEDSSPVSFLIEEIDEDGGVRSVTVERLSNSQIMVPSGHRKVVITVIAPKGTRLNFGIYTNNGLRG